MTTQEKEQTELEQLEQGQEKAKKLNVIFNEFREEDGGWYDRRLLYRKLQRSFDRLGEIREATQKTGEPTNEQKERLSKFLQENLEAQEQIEAIVFERCAEPEKLREYLNTLPYSKIFSFILETATKIGVFNPVSPN